MRYISGIPFTKNAKGPDDLEMLVISETSSMNTGKYTRRSSTFSVDI